MLSGHHLDDVLEFEVRPANSGPIWLQVIQVYNKMYNLAKNVKSLDVLILEDFALHLGQLHPRGLLLLRPSSFLTISNE